MFARPKIDKKNIRKQVAARKICLWLGWLLQWKAVNICCLSRWQMQRKRNWNTFFQSQNSFAISDQAVEEAFITFINYLIKRMYFQRLKCNSKKTLICCTEIYFYSFILSSKFFDLWITIYCNMKAIIPELRNFFSVKQMCWYDKDWWSTTRYYNILLTKIVMPSFAVDHDKKSKT